MDEETSKCARRGGRVLSVPSNVFRQRHCLLIHADRRVYISGVSVAELCSSPPTTLPPPTSVAITILGRTKPRHTHRRRGGLVISSPSAVSLPHHIFFRPVLSCLWMISISPAACAPFGVGPRARPPVFLPAVSSRYPPYCNQSIAFLCLLRPVGFDPCSALPETTCQYPDPLCWEDRVLEGRDTPSCGISRVCTARHPVAV